MKIQLSGKGKNKSKNNPLRDVTIEADVERIVEKGMELHEKDWREKRQQQHEAKKEILELRHKQKLEIEEQKATRKNWFQKALEENRKTKGLVLEDKRKREEIEIIERNKILKLKVIFSTILGFISLSLMILGFILGSASNNPDSSWHALSVIGMMIGAGIAFIWINKNKKTK